MENSLVVSLKVSHHQPYDPAIVLLDNFPKRHEGTCPYKDLYIIVHNFVIAQLFEQLKC